MKPASVLLGAIVISVRIVAGLELKGASRRGAGGGARWLEVACHWRAGRRRSSSDGAECFLGEGSECFSRESALARACGFLRMRGPCRVALPDFFLLRRTLRVDAMFEPEAGTGV
jgi:hypothetical protein